MSKEHWRRENPQFYNFMGLPRNTLDGPAGIEGLNGSLLSRDYPFQEEMCEVYLNEGDWDPPIEQALWSELPWKRFQENPEFEAWLRSRAAAE